MTKPTKWHVRPVKTQISLGIRPVWSASSLCAQWVAKDPSFLHADREDSDQTGRMPVCWFCHVAAFLSYGADLIWLYKNCIQSLTFNFNQKGWATCRYLITVSNGSKHPFCDTPWMMLPLCLKPSIKRRNFPPNNILSVHQNSLDCSEYRMAVVDFWLSHWTNSVKSMKHMLPKGKLSVVINFNHCRRKNFCP